MADKKRWSDLSPRSRRLITVGVAVETLLKIVALVDLWRRPAGQVKGSKAKWALAVALINSGGAAPLAYLAFGRRSQP